MKFDSNNLNENNYYHFDEGQEVYIIIYPIDLRNIEMITEAQLSYLRVFQDKNKIELWNEDRMFNFVTKSLASKIINRLKKGEEIRFAFSKQADTDTNEAFDQFKDVCNSLKK